MKCAFCNERKATHFNMDWDADLCDQCAREQEDMFRAAKVRDLPAEWRALIERLRDDRR